MREREPGGDEYILTGRVIDIQTGAGIPDVRVEAWDKKRRCNDLVACAFTDTLGIFRIVLEARHLRDLFLDRIPVLFFRIFEGQACIASTVNSAVWRVDCPESAFRIETNRAASTAGFTPAPFVVRGRVVAAGGATRTGFVVHAYHRQLRGEQFLSEATTDDTGSYRITYALDKPHEGSKPTLGLVDPPALVEPGILRPSRRASADLIVRAYDAKHAVVAEKKLCHAPPTATINLVTGGEVYRGPSTFERLLVLLAPALDGTSLADLVEQDVLHLACSLRIDIDDFRDLVAAFELARALGFHPAAVYGLFREGLPRERQALLTTRPAEQRRTLLLALVNVVPNPRPSGEDRALPPVRFTATAAPLASPQRASHRTRSSRTFLSVAPSPR